MACVLDPDTRHAQIIGRNVVRPLGPLPHCVRDAALGSDLDSNCVTDIADDLVAEFVSGSCLGIDAGDEQAAIEGAETPSGLTPSFKWRRRVTASRTSRRSAEALINACFGRTPPVQNAIVERQDSAQLRRPRPRSGTSALRVRRDKAALSSGCEAHPARSLQPEATGAVKEVTKWLKPSV